MQDNDGDALQCRWAAGAECAGVCSAMPHTTLANENSNCVLKIDTSSILASMWFAVALTIEDRPANNITINGIAYTTSTAISLVPLQFLVHTRSFTTACAAVPVFVSPTPAADDFLNTAVGSAISVTILAQNTTGSLVTSITVSGPVEGSVTPATGVDTGTGTERNVTWSWTPRSGQEGGHLLCFQAVDNLGKSSEVRCITIVVGVNCSDPGPGINAVRTPLAVSTFSYNETVSYTCNPGFIFGHVPVVFTMALSIQVPTRTCQMNGLFDGLEFTCYACSDPGFGVNANRLPATEQGFQQNDMVYYTCNDGYQFSSGNANRICQGNDVFDGAVYTCAPVPCSDPGDGVNAVRSLNSSHSFVFGDTVTYTCQSGYEYCAGDHTRTCQASGTFSGSPYECEEEDVGLEWWIWLLITLAILLLLLLLILLICCCCCPCCGCCKSRNRKDENEKGSGSYTRVGPIPPKSASLHSETTRTSYVANETDAQHGIVKSRTSSRQSRSTPITLAVFSEEEGAAASNRVVSKTPTKKATSDGSKRKSKRNKTEPETHQTTASATAVVATSAITKSSPSSKTVTADKMLESPVGSVPGLSSPDDGKTSNGTTFEKEKKFDISNLPKDATVPSETKKQPHAKPKTRDARTGENSKITTKGPNVKQNNLKADTTPNAQQPIPIVVTQNTFDGNPNDDPQIKKPEGQTADDPNPQLLTNGKPTVSGKTPEHEYRTKNPDLPNESDVPKPQVKNGTDSDDKPAAFVTAGTQSPRPERPEAANLHGRRTAPDGEPKVDSPSNSPSPSDSKPKPSASLNVQSPLIDRPEAASVYGRRTAPDGKPKSGTPRDSPSDLQNNPKSASSPNAQHSPSAGVHANVSHGTSPNGTSKPSTSPDAQSAPDKKPTPASSPAEKSPSGENSRASSVSHNKYPNDKPNDDSVAEAKPGPAAGSEPDNPEEPATEDEDSAPERAEMDDEPAQTTAARKPRTKKKVLSRYLQPRKTPTKPAPEADEQAPKKKAKKKTSKAKPRKRSTYYDVPPRYLQHFPLSVYRLHQSGN